jgi:MYXO-CTERM domain-containing protein
MKTFRNFAGALLLSMSIITVCPVTAQTVKDTSSITKPNGAGAGNGYSQGAPGAATVSGTGTGTLADSNSIASGDSGVKKVDATTGSGVAVQSTHNGSNWGLLGLVGLLGLFGLRKDNARA